MKVYKVMFQNNKVVSSARIEWDYEHHKMAGMDSEIGINWLVIFAEDEQSSLAVADSLFAEYYSVV